MCQFDGRFWGKYYRLWRSTSILPRVTPDGETVIGYDGELEQWDEIVVELTFPPSISQRVAHSENGLVTYLSVGTLCKPIENLTNPDRKFVYE